MKYKLTPVGQKLTSWNLNTEILCPTQVNIDIYKSIIKYFVFNFLKFSYNRQIHSYLQTKIVVR
jgi:hypothetical protein